MTYQVLTLDGTLLSEHVDLLDALPAMRADVRAREIRRSDGALIARCVHSSAKIPMTAAEHRGDHKPSEPTEKSKKRMAALKELRATKPWIAPVGRP